MTVAGFDTLLAVVAIILAVFAVFMVASGGVRVSDPSGDVRDGWTRLVGFGPVAAGAAVGFWWIRGGRMFLTWLVGFPHTVLLIITGLLIGWAVSSRRSGVRVWAAPVWVRGLLPVGAGLGVLVRYWDVLGLVGYTVTGVCVAVAWWAGRRWGVWVTDTGVTVGGIRFTHVPWSVFTGVHVHGTRVEIRRRDMSEVPVRGAWLTSETVRERFADQTRKAYLAHQKHQP